MIVSESLTKPISPRLEIDSYAFFSKLCSRQNYCRQQEQESSRIRWLLAINPNTPAPILDCLASEDVPSLLERIAENPSTRPATLSRLAIHDNPRIRAAVTENSNIDKKTMWRLAHDIHPDVRMRLAEGYFLPLIILQLLADDDNPYVQNRARKTLLRLKQPELVSLSLGCC